MNTSKGEVIKNFILNALSYALPTLVLQFVVQPIIARRIGGEANGQYLTLMSLNYFIIAITANVLNTVRMLQDAKYKEQKIVGDFNFFFLLYSIIIVICFPLGFLFFAKAINIVDIILYVFIGLLYLYHDYIFAQYRLQLKFNKILINNGILIAGYFIGILLFLYVIPKWQIIIIAGYLLGGIYDYFNTTFIKEPIGKTVLFKETSHKISSLTCANALSSSITYFDKLLLYPLLGGSQVSIYNTASLVGKMLILVSAPLNSFVLSYLVKMKHFKTKIRFKHIFVCVIALVLAYVCCVAIGYPLTNILYPDWALESQKLIPITVAASLFTLVGNLLNTVIIRFYKTTYQIIVQGFNLILYLLITLSLLKTSGLIGFSCGIAIVAFIKMVTLAIVIIKLPDSKSNKS